MNKQLSLLVLLTFVASFFAAPSAIYFSTPRELRNQAEEMDKRIPSWLPKNYMKLGLDLQGGVQLVLGVDIADAVDNRLSRISADIKRWATETGIGVENAYVVRGQQILRVELAESQDFNDFNAKFGVDFLGFDMRKRDGQKIDYVQKAEELEAIKMAALEQAEKVIRSRVDKWGVSEPLINRRADGAVMVQLPGFSDPEKAKELLGRTAQLEFRIVDDEFAGFDSLEAPEGIASTFVGGHKVFSGEDKAALVALLKPLVPSDRELLFEQTEISGGKKLRYSSYVVRATAEVTGEDIFDAFVTRDTESIGQMPMVSLRFTNTGAKRFADLTGANIKKRLAIVLDGIVISAPTLDEKISGGQAVIRLGQGGYQESFDEASSLSLILKSGALPATINVLEERQVGASLGPELAQKGIYAIFIGLGMICLFIIGYYRRPGMIACVVLLLNGLFLLTLMAGFGAALTLPGIAGFILTLGMAVDANILINERIRQEITQGKPVRRAVQAAFEKVKFTILDANITTLIAAFVLLETNSSGPIKGFALTLIIGLLVSVFTSIYCTRIILEFFVNRSKSDAALRSWFVTPEFVSSEKAQKISYLNFSKYFHLFSIVLILGAAIMGATRGMNWSVDFAGGTELEVIFDKQVDVGVVRGVVEAAGFGQVAAQALRTEQGDKGSHLLLRFDSKALEVGADTNNTVIDKLFSEKLSEYGPKIQRIDFVGPQIGKELRTQGVQSLVWALLGIFVYILFRFDLRFAPGVVLKMLHDVGYIFAFYIFFWRSFDLTSVAAILTIVGYSVNDTIVIYDRIRENLDLYPRRPIRESINISIGETLTRSVNTSISTIVALVGLLVVQSSDQLWNFAAAMVLGVVVATLSSTFLATDSIVWLDKFYKNRAAKKLPSKAVTSV